MNEFSNERCNLILLFFEVFIDCFHLMSTWSKRKKIFFFSFSLEFNASFITNFPGWSHHVEVMCWKFTFMTVKEENNGDKHQKSLRWWIRNWKLSKRQLFLLALFIVHCLRPIFEGLHSPGSKLSMKNLLLRKLKVARRPFRKSLLCFEKNVFAFEFIYLFVERHATNGCLLALLRKLWKSVYIGK